eukprot:TRINITY_DN22883_c0_g1_i3.p1 TRINITY_DN22883_c0_g1~~TRINITY_DN22883_c0_g1_i3.p1  ORF type:complete len:117 (+),score=32.62 TRINITY_DN22883_c0_g1_i3:135-485(+)
MTFDELFHKETQQFQRAREQRQKEREELEKEKNKIQDDRRQLQDDQLLLKKERQSLKEQTDFFEEKKRMLYNRLSETDAKEEELKNTARRQLYESQKIGRAVQQECRDRSRMPSSA